MGLLDTVLLLPMCLQMHLRCMDARQSRVAVVKRNVELQKQTSVMKARSTTRALR